MSIDKRLEGGRKEIHVDGDVVKRPLCDWTKTVHNYLGYISPKVTFAVPTAIASCEKSKTESVSYVDGESFNYPLPDVFYSDEMIVSAAHCLRVLHDASRGFIDETSVEEVSTTAAENHCWMLSPIKPFDVICHGDFAPYNVSIVGGKVVGVFDFDTIHPSPAVRDIAYAIYRFVPIMDSEVKLRSITNETLLMRVSLFLEAYNYAIPLAQLFDVMIERIEDLICYMKAEANSGSVSFADNIDNGHIQCYLDDIELIRSLKLEVTSTR